jgi:hypothetical protein
MQLPRNAERSLDEAPGHRRGFVCGSLAINHGNPGGYEFQTEICGLYLPLTYDQ